MLEHMRIAANAVNRDTFDIFDGRLHFVEVGTRNTFRKFPTSVNNRRDRLFAFRTTIINTSVVHPIRRQLLRSVFIGKLTPTIRPVTIYYTRFNECCATRSRLVFDSRADPSRSRFSTIANGTEFVRLSENIENSQRTRIFLPRFPIISEEYLRAMNY